MNSHRTFLRFPRLLLPVAVWLLLAIVGGGALYASAPTVFDIWLGDTQRFGQAGISQQWVNVTGNVTDTDGLKSLFYSLNGGGNQMLTLGSNGTRLAEAGDFNIEVAYADLNPGANTVRLTATDNSNDVTVRDVIVDYVTGVSLPLPYTADWSEVNAITETSQIVDGKWTLEAESIRPSVTYYDRLVAVGDINWTDYEVVVPITVHALDPNAPYGPPGGAPGAGMIVRWQGHNQDRPGQPRVGWDNSGALTWFRWTQGNSGGKMLMKGNTNVFVDNSRGKQVQFGKTYYYKTRSVTVPGVDSFYNFRIWEAGTPEPVGWDIIGEGDPQSVDNGSVLLIAHYVDASYGDVVVTPVTDLVPDIFTQVQGNGTISVSPDPNNGPTGHTYNREVTITAQPAAGWRFERWADEMLAGQPAELQLRMTEDVTPTAVFVPEAGTVSYTLGTSVTGQGSIMVDPQKATYNYGEQVTLTPVPAAGWSFANWSGDATDSANPLVITMDGNKQVAANFTQNQYTVGVAAQPAEGGTITRTPDKTTYVYGEQVTLTATPNTGYEFIEWTSDASGSNATVVITVDGNESAVAEFAQIRHPLVAAASPPEGGTVQVAPDENDYAFGATVTLTAQPASGWRFAGWSGDLTGSTNPAQVTMDASKLITATFEEGQYTVNVTVDPAGDGSVTRSPAQVVFKMGEQVTLTPVAAPGWTFAGWAGDLTGSDNPATITVNADRNISARFTQDQYTLTTQVANGAITRTPEKATYVYGEVVTLTAVADPNFIFTGWSGDANGFEETTTVTMNGNRSVTAGFARPEFTLTAEVPGGGGTITYYPDKLQYAAGMTVTLIATAADGFTFTGWGGDASGGQTTTSVTMDGNKTVTATFAPIAHVLTLGTKGSGTATANPNKTQFAANEKVELTATPETGWTFTGWYRDGQLLSSSNPYELTVDASQTVEAVFVQGTLTISAGARDASGNALSDNVGLSPMGPYFIGQQVELTARSIPNMRFERWEGDVPAGQSATSPTLTVTVTGNLSLTAIYANSALGETESKVYLPLVAGGQ